MLEPEFTSCEIWVTKQAFPVGGEFSRDRTLDGRHHLAALQKELACHLTNNR